MSPVFDSARGLQSDKVHSTEQDSDQDLVRSDSLSVLCKLLHIYTTNEFVI